MMTRGCISSICTLIAFLPVFGCSGHQSPATPGVDGQAQVSAGDLSTPTSGVDGTSGETAEPARQHQLWGYYICYYDPEAGEIEFIPLRDAVTHFNILGFLEDGPCFDCLGLQIIGASDHDTLLVNVTVIHPFSNANLTGFDVRGIVVLDGSYEFPDSGLTIPDRSSGDGELVDAHGYTSLYNFTTVDLDPTGIQSYIRGNLATAIMPNAHLNGYKRYFSYGPENTRNAFYAGDTVTVLYDIALPDWPAGFGYAIDACWTPATNKPVENPMTDFPPEANCPEPWKIAVTEDPIGLGLHEEGGQTVLSIDVYDRGGKDSHAAPVVEGPEFFPGTLAAVWDEDGDGFSRYQVTVTNPELAPIGEYRCLISVEDNENATSPDWLDLTAYLLWNLEVVEYENLPPTPAAHASSTEVVLMEVVEFFDDSTDPDGLDDIVKWEWDFSFNVFQGFVVDSEEQNPTWQYDHVGPMKVRLRVTDSVDHVSTLQPPININVSYANLPPVAAAHADPTDTETDIPVNFFDDSTDPDGVGDITLREWDFTFDPLDGFLIDSVEQNPVFLYETPGVYGVQLRVTDTLFQTDMLDEPFNISVVQANLWPIAMAHSSATTVYQGDFVDFFDDSTDPDGPGDIVEWAWDFSYESMAGFQVESEDQNPIYQFLTDGFFEVQLRVTDSDDHSDMLDEPLIIEVEYVNLPPDAAAFATSYEVNIKELFFLCDASTDPNGPDDIVGWEWDMSYGSGEPDPDGFDQNQWHVYHTEGIYRVMLRVTDSADHTDMLDEPLIITVNWVNLPPIARAYVPVSSVHVGETVYFYDESGDPDGDDDIIIWEWDFTYDGNLNVESEEQDPTWIYDEPGWKYVMLYVEDTAGNRSRLTYVEEIHVS